MSQLRNKLIEVQKDQTLREFLQNNFDATSDVEKDRILSLLGDSIEKDVDKMIREEVEEQIALSPVKKKSKKIQLFVISANVPLTVLSGFFVNDKEWIYLLITSIIMISVLTLPLFLED